jgi:hypothetical protein
MHLESAASPIGHINCESKLLGKRSAGNPHATFDEAGAGNGMATSPRQFSTLPVRGSGGSSLRLLDISRGQSNLAQGWIA